MEIVRVRRGTFKFANLEADPVTKLLTTCYIADDQTVAAEPPINSPALTEVRFAEGKPTNRAAAVVIVLIWLALLILAAIWIWRTFLARNLA